MFSYFILSVEKYEYEYSRIYEYTNFWITRRAMICIFVYSEKFAISYSLMFFSMGIRH